MKPSEIEKLRQSLAANLRCHQDCLTISLLKDVHDEFHDGGGLVAVMLDGIGAKVPWGPGVEFGDLVRSLAANLVIESKRKRGK